MCFQVLVLACNCHEAAKPYQQAGKDASAMHARISKQAVIISGVVTLKTWEPLQCSMACAKVCSLGRTAGMTNTSSCSGRSASLAPCLEAAERTEEDSEERKRPKLSGELMPLSSAGGWQAQQPVTLMPSCRYSKIQEWH